MKRYKVQQSRFSDNIYADSVLIGDKFLELYKDGSIVYACPVNLLSSVMEIPDHETLEDTISVIKRVFDATAALGSWDYYKVMEIIGDKRLINL